jgi:Ca-activated chloride channel family protein
MILFRDTIEFVNPEFFLLLLLLPVLGIWYYRRRSNYYATLRMSSLESIRRMRSWRGWMRGALPLLRVLAFIALVIAMARPQEVVKEEEIEAEGIDIMMAIDLSSSMLSQDFNPNRLEVSKRVATEFVNKRKYDRIGLAVFAGEAYTQCPLTIDHEVLKNFLAELECGELEDGTAIGMGLATAVRHLEDSEAKSKIVILLTDGVNNAGYINPDVAAQIASKLGIKVYTIGVGSKGEAYTPLYRHPVTGQYKMGLAKIEIDENLLKEIASKTNGEYYRATSVESLEEIYDTIDELEKSKVEMTILKRYSEAFHPFAFWGLLLLVLEALLRYTVLRTIP